MFVQQALEIVSFQIMLRLLNHQNPDKSLDNGTHLSSVTRSPLGPNVHRIVVGKNDWAIGFVSKG